MVPFAGGGPERGVINCRQANERKTLKIQTAVDRKRGAGQQNRGRWEENLVKKVMPDKGETIRINPSPDSREGERINASC